MRIRVRRANSWLVLKSETEDGKLKISSATFSLLVSQAMRTPTSRQKEAAYFFNSAVQFCTSVTGSVPSFTPLLMRNFFPSAVTS